MNRIGLNGLIVLAALGITLPTYAEPVRLSKETYRDKCQGAWAGQMIGVCYGAPYEFQSNGKPITGALQEWTPERVAGAIGQDDCYVEMTFLKALEDHGLSITFEQAGRAFGESQYPLWHANYYGRENVRRGIMPPKSGNPKYNRHADDIDFQIESDLFGILCPGLPKESNRLCNIFGHIMNYGDGVYGGMFVSGMYAAAYLEGNDVGKVVEAGLRCIPAQSEFYRCIADVVRWHNENPRDWLAAWKKIEETWQDDVDCEPGNPFNIDAKLNGAYIVMGLLYGNGDMRKTMEIATRCGQDADCNSSNAAGVLGCMKGYRALGGDLTGGIAAIETQNFSHTNYSFQTLIPACERLTDQIVRRAGGEVSEDGYLIPVQPAVPAKLEQWTHQKKLLLAPPPQSEVSLWNSAWKVLACGTDMAPGVRSEYRGRDKVLVLHPVSQQKPAAIEARFMVPKGRKPALRIEAASDERGDFLLRVLVNGKHLAEEVVDTRGEWRTVTADLSPYAGKRVTVRVENCANGWSFEAAYFSVIALVADPAG